VATTFFGQQYFSTPFAFFGTSAAAPSVAGVAALMIEAAGGPRSIDASTVLLILQGTAPPRDLSPLFAQAGEKSTGRFARRPELERRQISTLVGRIGVSACRRVGVWAKRRRGD